MRLGRLRVLIVVLPALLGVVVGSCIHCMSGFYVGDGSFDMEVHVDLPEDSQVARVRFTPYVERTLEAQEEQLALATFDRDDGFDFNLYKDARNIAANKYAVWVWYSERHRGNCRPVKYHRGDFVLVRVDLTDGRKFARIFASPPLGTPEPRILQFEIR